MDIKLTEYSHGAGCGCKIAPDVLSTILKTEMPSFTDEKLIVGNSTRDDAAVYDIGQGKGIISTTDFFMPIVDDPFTFGQIAATNAISDVYAMGGKPIMAIAILGWPIDKLAPEIAAKVLEGGREVCNRAGIALAGGHSIDSPEPIFGLAVTGIVDLKNVKKNASAKQGSLLFLTKPLGVGILSTAQKRKILKPEHENIATAIMTKLNDLGSVLSEIEGVTALTDVTGFGLIGHLTEICEGSNLSAVLEFEKIPKIKELPYYIAQNCFPGGMQKNWRSYGKNVKLHSETYKPIFCDPQTSGGLLIAVLPSSVNKITGILAKNEMSTIPFGQLTAKNETLIEVK